MLGAIRAYKLLISPLYTGSCRFEPSCSDYMADAVRQHGALWGVLLGVRRLARCRPLGGHGFDPVPPPSAVTSREMAHRTPGVSAPACRPAEPRF